jgi:hypothetical protein
MLVKEMIFIFRRTGHPVEAMINDVLQSAFEDGLLSCEGLEVCVQDSEESACL